MVGVERALLLGLHTYTCGAQPQHRERRIVASCRMGWEVGSTSEDSRKEGGGRQGDKEAEESFSISRVRV